MQTTVEQSRYLEALGKGLDFATFGKRFLLHPGTSRIQTIPTIQNQNVAWDSLPNRDMVRYVYIEPLRDAKREFKNHTGSRLARILRLISQNPEDIQQLKEQVHLLENELVSTPVDDEKSILSDLPNKINQELSRLTQSENSAISLRANDQDLSRLMRRFRLSFVEEDEFWEVDDVGLGYANLLYLATLLLELSNQPPDVFSILLIEEPEAHLHPKLQESLVSFLDEHAKENGNLQILLTTHSPIIAAKAKCRSICGLNKNSNETTFWHGSDLKSAPEETDKLDRFFVSQRPEAIFSKHVLLVEGTAEELLLPALFEAYFRGTRINEAKAQIQQMRETLCICSVNSASFTPHWAFSKLSRPGDTGRKLGVLTDADWAPDQWELRQTIRSDDIHNTQGGRRLQEIGFSHTGMDPERPDFGGFLSHTTFEHELLTLALKLHLQEESSELFTHMRNIFSKLHPRIYKSASDAFNQKSFTPKPTDTEVECVADDIWLTISNSSLKKAIFAQELAHLISFEELSLKKLPSKLDEFVDAISPQQGKADAKN